MKQRVALILLGIGILVMYSSWGRSLWIDEFLHFAFGGFDTPAQAWAAVQSSTTDINHGQTGFYMMLDYFLLKAAGANLFVMRLPSLLSGALLLYGTAVFLRSKHIGAIGIAAAFVLLAAQPNLMYYVGEARPYMPLAAACVGVLAYYSTPVVDRARLSMRLLGWGSVIWGSLMQPYFLLYWPVLALAAYGFDCFINHTRPALRPAITFFNIPLIITGFILGVGISAMTWLRGGPAFDRDPWLYIRPLFDNPNWLLIGAVLIAACVAAVTIVLALAQGTREQRRSLLPPVLLMIITGAIAFFFGFMSFIQDYWVIPRQFIASQALMTITVIWLLAAALVAIRNPAKTILATVMLVSICLAAGRALVVQIREMSDWSAAQVPVSDISIETDNAFDLVAPANENVRRGGPVLSEFARIYDRPHFAPNEDPRLNQTP